MARPMPCAPPVTIATLPSSLPMLPVLLVSGVVSWRHQSVMVREWWASGTSESRLDRAAEARDVVPDSLERLLVVRPRSRGVPDDPGVEAVVHRELKSEPHDVLPTVAGVYAELVRA